MPPPTDFSLDIPIFAKLYDFYKNLSQVLSSYPKTKRYTLGAKLENITLDILQSVILAGYLPRERKLPAVEQSQAMCELLKILLRFSHDIKLIDSKKYIHLEQSLLEIGRMLGGWKRSLKT